VGASVAANILHAQRNPISETIAGWPPLALLLTVELVSRVPMHRRLLAAVRVVATAVISGIAAWVSYWHMVGVAGRYGETDASPYLLPVSVDGLIVVASISLVELAGRIRTAETATEPVPAQSTVASPPAGFAPVVQVPTAEPITAPDPPRASPTPAAVPARVDQLVPAPPPELVARARSVATAHHRTTGTDITVDQLAGYLRVPADTAGVLHALVLNADAGTGHREPIGELTR
jgi:hypothetical protein